MRFWEISRANPCDKIHPFELGYNLEYQIWFWFRFLLNHGCKTQIAIFNKKANITVFSRLEILKVCTGIPQVQKGAFCGQCQFRMFINDPVDNSDFNQFSEKPLL